MGTLVLANGTYDKIKEYVAQIDAEIGMFGYVTMDGNDFTVDEVFLVEQEVSGSSVDFADKGLDYAIQRAIKDDRVEDLKFCCHSHVDMDAFWSGTDDKMIAGMNNGMTPYLVSLVINKKSETKQRVDFYNPAGPIGEYTGQVTFDLSLEVEEACDPAIADEIATLVTQRKFAQGYRVGRPNSQYNWWSQDEVKQLSMPASKMTYDDHPNDDDIKAMGFADRKDFESFMVDLDYEDFIR